MPDRDAPPDRIPPGAFAALALIAASTFLAMSVWFSASFVVPQLREAWALSAGEASLLTIGVQIGFVAGALISAATGLADMLPGRRLMVIGALGAAAANLILLAANGIVLALIARVLTGMFLALVYPPALKEVSTWFRVGRGTALGVMIGALTLGSALPHLVNAFANVDWRPVIVATTLITACGGGLMLLARTSGPYANSRSTFRMADAMKSLSNRSVVLANIGYIGHMWELYAMWAWLGAFLTSLPAIAGSEHPVLTASLLAFGCIGVGAIGCLVGGVISDRYGRPQSALLALICSGTAAVSIAAFRHAPIQLVLVLCAFWGFWVIADSAQFSALVTEHADPAYVGSAVSAQLALGYLTTTATLWLVPVLAEALSWSWAIATLALGPIAGSLAMLGLLDRRANVKQSTP